MSTWASQIFDPFASSITKADLAFPNDEHLEPIGNFTSERGHTVPLRSVSETGLSEAMSSIYSMGKIMRGRKSSNVQQPPSSVTSQTPSPTTRSSMAMSPGRLSSSGFHFTSPLPNPMDGMGGLSDSRFNDVDSFSAKGIRKAFLRFFVTLLKKYASYLVAGAGQSSNSTSSKVTDALFDSESFLRDVSDAAAKPFHLSTLEHTNV
ncbi:hypothetical protein PINS_up000117 [Pythium insidiosum]|nr:hypothetical protein PINS_up000117 [Pythium insidiosum]